MIKMKGLLNEATYDDWQRLRQELLTACRDLTYTVDNSNSPAEAGDSGYSPVIERKAITKTRKFLAKVQQLEKEWKTLARSF